MAEYPGSEARSGTWGRSGGVAGGDPRAVALGVVERCLRTGRPAAGLMEDAARRLDERDRALAQRLATLLLRWLLRLDDIVERASGRAIGQVDRRLLGPLRLGVVQILFMDRIPAHAAVSTAVDLAASRTRAGAGFVNAVLRKVAAADGLDSFPVAADDPRQRLSIETSHGRFLVDRWVETFGLERAERILRADNEDRPASFLVVGGASRRRGAIDRLAEEGIAARPSELSPLGLLAEGGSPTETGLYREGAIYPQDEASQCAALVPPPRAAELILDAAASPGGKTLASLAWEPTARLLAADGHLPRLARLLDNRRRCGARFAVLASDAERPALAGGFDRVLADLPCSGSGILRKHPELKWRIDPAEIERLSGAARDMLDGLVPLVGEGGLLVVATCSLEREENEDQVAALVRRHPDLDPLDLRGLLPAELEGGLEGSSRWRLYPEADHDGFTVHVLQRTSR